MKTAMQELIELMGLDINLPILQKALEKEKEQMIDFAYWYEAGLTNKQRWSNTMEEHYKDYLLFSRKPNL